MASFLSISENINNSRSGDDCEECLLGCDDNVISNISLSFKAQYIKGTINKCPDQAPGSSSHYTDFQGSQCRPDNPQAWTIRCSSDDGMSISVQNFQGSCNPNEVCVDHVTSPNHPSAAYCVSQIPSLRMASAQYNGQLRDVRITPNYKIGNNYLMGAILSGQSGITAAFTTSHIIFEAQDSNRKTLPGGTADCDSCQRIGLEAVPQGTSSFLATVTLPKSDDVAILYAAGITGGTGF